MPNADRAAVAREVLTELEAWLDDGRKPTVAAAVIREFKAEHYPAPRPRERATMKLGAIRNAEYCNGRTIKLSLEGRTDAFYMSRDELRALFALDARVDADGYEVEAPPAAGNGHVASAAEAAGSLREAPTAPAPSSPEPRRWHIVVDREGDLWEKGDIGLDRYLPWTFDGEVVESSALDAAQKEVDRLTSLLRGTLCAVEDTDAGRADTETQLRESRDAALARLREAPRMTDEVVERAAAAMWGAYPKRQAWDVVHSASADRCRNEARAVLRALGYQEAKP